jgi:transposase InsO family protein
VEEPGEPARLGRRARDQRRLRHPRDDPAFGCRFIVDELRERGLQAGENRVARLCSQQRIWSIFAKKRGLTRKAVPPVHDDLVDRVFTATAPNAVWLTDITEHPTAEGKLYLCAIKDLHSGRIVGYSRDARMTASLAVSALRNAIALRSPAGTIVHSDRGSQFRLTAFVRTVKNNGLVGSMGRVGACGDNAAMESILTTVIVVGGVCTGSPGSLMPVNEPPMSVYPNQPRSGLSTSPPCSVKVTVVIDTAGSRSRPAVWG